jgi:Reverse transcriptase (RNA-dependent DNA polymerase)
VQGVDFNDVFSPVVKHTSIRVLLSLVVMKGLELKQLDVKTAFLYGDLDEQIYMKQPEGFEITGKEDHVCLLKKSLYGLKQSPRQWYKKFDSFMVNLNFSRSNYDSCVYLKRLDDGDYIYLLFYVDDILIAATNMGEIKKLKEQLSMAFEMKDLGAAKKILGMKIIRDWSNQKLFLSQKEFAGNVISRFGMEKIKVVSTPLAAHFKLSVALSPTSDGERSYMEKISYSSAVESPTRHCSSR